MGSTVSSYSTAKRLEVGSPGGGAAGRHKKGHDAEAEARRALADRIEDNLTELLRRVEEIIRINRGHVLALAHALETHKTLSGEDVVAVIEHGQGPLVDGRPYGAPGFLAELEDYHRSATEAHREHSQAPLGLPPVHALGVTPQDALGPAQGVTAVLDRDPLIEP
jgi:cell division protease FtsH